MKLEIGQFIRLKDGFNDILGIGKIAFIANCGIVTISFKDKKLGVAIENIKKVSFDIVDLLEEGDLVGIEYYSSQSKERVTRLFEIDYKYGKSLNLMNSHFQFLILDGKFSKKSEEFEPIIRTVTTKEQVEQISYRVGEEI